MEDDVAGVINGDLKVKIHIELGVHEGVISIIKILGGVHFTVSSHDDLVAVGVDVSLAQGHRLCEDVVARSEQVYKENLVISDQAKHSLIVVACALRAVCDDDSL